jgi:orotate phosphoribosyltransferase
LTDYEHVISEAAETGYVTEADLELLREWRKNPAEWGK